MFNAFNFESKLIFKNNQIYLKYLFTLFDLIYLKKT